MKILLVIVEICCLFANVLSQNQPLCDSKIFCQSELLDMVQRARIYTNSKTFVDMRMTKGEAATLTDFNQLLQSTNQKPSKEDLTQFVNEHFEDFNPFDNWTPTDYTDDPAFISGIIINEMKRFAQDIVKIWPQLTKKIKKEVFDSPESFSLIPMKNGYVVSGFQTMQFNYWENYWIVRGLLLSEMFDTAKGILENFFWLVEKYGFVPSENRVYSLDRTQLPLLTLMVFHYIQSTNDIAWLKQNIATLDKELTFWLNERTVEVKKDGSKYILARYGCKTETPRPDAYYEDVKVVEHNSLNEYESSKWYAEVKSTVESGWGFASRWNVPGIDLDSSATRPLRETHPRELIPVDLNAFLCQAFRILSNFYTQLGDTQKATFWSDKSIEWQENIKTVLYNEEKGIWFDFNLVLSQPNANYYASNLTPLFCQTHNLSDSEILGKSALQYLNNENVLDSPFGVPTSNDYTTRPTDFPYAWAVMQHIIIVGLHQSGDKEAQNVAKKLCRKWLETNYNVYKKYGQMFDTYRIDQWLDERKAHPGYGCTNGADLILINYCFGYGENSTASLTGTTSKVPIETTPKIPIETTPKTPTVTTPKLPTVTTPKLPTVTTPKIPNSSPLFRRILIFPIRLLINILSFIVIVVLQIITWPWNLIVSIIL